MGLSRPASAVLPNAASRIRATARVAPVPTGFFHESSRAGAGRGHTGYKRDLEVTEVTGPGSEPARSSQPQGFSRRHPHTIGTWNANNTIYSGAGRTATAAAPGLRLSRPNGPVSRWTVSAWLRDAGFTYHGSPARWRTDGTLHAAARGEEFVADAGSTGSQADARKVHSLFAPARPLSFSKLRPGLDQFV